MTRLLNDPLIFDTSAVYCFGHRGGLEHIVSRLSTRYSLLIPPAAAHEVLSEQGYDYPGFLGSHFSQQEFTASRIENTWLSDAAVSLGAGEIAVLLLTHEVGGTAVIDEKAARSVARDMGLPCVGTFGLLWHAIERGWMSDGEALEAATRLRRAGFRCPATLGFATYRSYFEKLGGG